MKIATPLVAMIGIVGDGGSRLPYNPTIDIRSTAIGKRVPAAVDSVDERGSLLNSNRLKPTPPTDRTGRAGSPAWRRYLAPAVLFIGACAFYLPSSRFGFIYDDYQLVVNVAPPQATADFAEVFVERHWKGLPYYRPLARLTMVGQKFLHGNDPAPFHVFNAVLIGLAALLVYVLLRSPGVEVPSPLAFLASGTFAVHPVASCTVYPICSGRETLLPTIFILAAVGAWLREGRLGRATAFTCFAVALLCKEQAVVVPVLFLLADCLGLSMTRGSTSTGKLREWTRRHWPSLIILASYLAIRWVLFRGTNEHRLAIVERPFGPLLSVLYALQVTFFPFFDLVYEPPAEIWLSEWRLVGCLLVVFVAGLLSYRFWPVVRARILFWLGWCVLALLPTSNLLEQEARFAERYVFLALVGIAGIAATLASSLWNDRRGRQTVLGFGSSAMLTLAVFSFHRGPTFQDDVSFHSQWVRTNPNSDLAHRSLGWAWLQRGELRKAANHLQIAIRLNPGNAEAWNNMGNVLQRRGDAPGAETCYQEALRLNPDFAQAHNNLAIVLALRGRLKQSEAHFRRAISLRPRYSEAHNGLGIVLVRQDRRMEALDHFRRAVAIDPGNVEAHRNLGTLLESLGRSNEAAEHFRRARELGRDSARAP